METNVDTVAWGHDITQRMRQARLIAGVTQLEVTRGMGTCASDLVRLERSATPRVDTIYRYMAAVEQAADEKGYELDCRLVVRVVPDVPLPPLDPKVASARSMSRCGDRVMEDAADKLLTVLQLVEARRLAGITREEWCQWAQVARRTLSSFEGGEWGPDGRHFRNTAIVTMRKLALGVDRDLEFLFTVGPREG